MSIALNSRLNSEYLESNIAGKVVKFTRAFDGATVPSSDEFWSRATPRQRAMLREVSENLDDPEIAFAQSWQLTCETGLSPSVLMRYASTSPARQPRGSAMGAAAAVALAFVFAPFLA